MVRFDLDRFRRNLRCNVATLFRPSQSGNTIVSRRTRKTLSPSFRAKVALAAIRDDSTLVEWFEVHRNEIRSWKKRLVESAEEARNRCRSPHVSSFAEPSGLEIRVRKRVAGPSDEDRTPHVLYASLPQHPRLARQCRQT